MVRPSNPKVMARVLEAVTHLGDGKGSLTQDVLRFMKHNSSGSMRNLTMQVRRALKHAVNAGLLRCKGGRYKIQFALNPVGRSHRQQLHQREEPDNHKPANPSDDLNEELPVGGVDHSRGIQDRAKSSRKKRAARKGRKRSATRTAKRKVTRRRGAGMDRKARKMSKHTKRRKTRGDESEDWNTRKRRMMSKYEKVDDDHEDGKEEDNEEDEYEEDGDEEREMPEPRKILKKMRSVNEDRYSDISGASGATGRHRSRRSKHLANERKSPTRRGNGDAENQRKSMKRSTSRRRGSQPRQRESRQDAEHEEQLEDPETIMDEERDNDVMEMDEDQDNGECPDTPPENPGVA